MSFIITEIKDNVGYIILNRGEKKNAFNQKMINEMKIALTHFENQDDIRVVVLKSNSDVFSAGADLDYLQNLQSFSFEENLKDSNNLKELFVQIYTFPKITVSQIEGHAIAGGCGIATVTDFSFSVPEAKFGYTEVKIGFIPALVSVFLIRKISGRMARELLLSGALIDASEAERIGLISLVINSSNIEEYTYNFSQKLATTTSPSSVSSTKKILEEVYTLNFEQGMEVAAIKNAETRDSNDCKKGITAFLQKQKIKWV